MKGDLGAMMARHFSDGCVQGIIIRPERRALPIELDKVDVSLDGLQGDHSRAGKRAVTLLQVEHLPVISALLGRREVDPSHLRRNLLISGINLLGLRKSQLQIGTCQVYIHGPCPPCSRMEEAFGPGGYSAVRGHGGVYAEVISAGSITLGCNVMRVDEAV
ncbi:MAG: MOSC domain-containing protein [Boseongicola sp.]|nr:MOSC domain-containing protein [Boseongicola sp.]